MRVHADIKDVTSLPRDLPVSNGNLLINHDLRGYVRCIYYPYIGQENHALDHLSRFGLRINDEFAWLDNEEWQKEAKYIKNSLIAQLVFRHPRLGVTITLQDAVDHHDNVFVRKIIVDNHTNHPINLQSFFHLDINLYGSQMANTVLYHPGLSSLMFYKGHRYVTLSCQKAGETGSQPAGYACGQKGMHGLEGTWRDAEDGRLQGHTIAQGSVDGVIQLNLDIEPKQQAQGYFWVCFAKSLPDVEQLESIVRSKSPQTLLDRTKVYWSRWLSRDKINLSLLPRDFAEAYRTSLLIARSNIDNRGAIVAANDSSMLKNAEDSYSYMWPRDGALIAYALDTSGYHHITRKFFDFCKEVIMPEGYLMHKYNPDGSMGASWLPWINGEGDAQLPIQEDETALVIYALWNHHQVAMTIDESLEDYQNFVLPAAEFMMRFRDSNGLPKPSYDLWEERYGVFAFTTAAVYAGLHAAAKFARYHGELERSGRFESAAQTMKQMVVEHFYDKEQRRFARAILPSTDDNHQTTYTKDMTADASMYALFGFGMFEPTEPKIVKTMTYLFDKLQVRTAIGGTARYERDYYYNQTGDNPDIPGNPWFICTLWHADWLIQSAQSLDDLDEGVEIIRWAIARALPSGVMAEQLHPLNGAPLSVSPLTWSHATLVQVIQDYLNALHSFQLG